MFSDTAVILRYEREALQLQLPFRGVGLAFLVNIRRWLLFEGSEGRIVYVIEVIQFERCWK